MECFCSECPGAVLYAPNHFHVAQGLPGLQCSDSSACLMACSFWALFLIAVCGFLHLLAQAERGPAVHKNPAVLNHLSLNSGSQDSQSPELKAPWNLIFTAPYSNFFLYGFLVCLCRHFGHSCWPSGLGQQVGCGNVHPGTCGMCSVLGLRVAGTNGHMFRNPLPRTSLVAQEIRIHLLMQGTWVRSLVWEDPTCHRTTKLVCSNYWARPLEPVSHSYRTWEPKLLKPMRLEPVPHTREATAMRSLNTAMKSGPRSLQLEEAHTKQWRLSAAQNK